MIVHSFGFKYGNPAASLPVLDCRRLRNPHYDDKLRGLTGLDNRVQAYVANDPGYAALLAAGLAVAAEGRDVAFGCYGGRHRSVALAERLVAALSLVGVCATAKHHCL